jgi:hypothetical protein
MTDEHVELLRILGDSKGYVACDGKHRTIAHSLEDAGFAEWKGESWGSSFWAITDSGKSELRRLT